MYPQVSQSPKFKRALLKTIIDYDKNINLKTYVKEYYKLSQSDEKSNNEFAISELEEECFDILNKILVIDVNHKDGFVVISATMPIAEYSTVVTNKAKEILQNIIIENKIESARQNLIFSQNQLSEKRLLFDEIQAKLAYFSDSNLNTVNSFVINEKSKLEADFEIINSVVTELSNQVENAKLLVKKNTPVFSTIKEAVIPNKRSSPKRTQIVLIFSLVGFISSIIYILSKETIKQIFTEIKTK